MKRFVLLPVALICGCAVAERNNPGDQNSGGNVGGGPVGTDADLGDAIGNSDGGAAHDLAASHDLAGAHDLASSHDLAGVDLASPPQSSCVPRINELMTGATSAATTEFVELYNPCGQAVSLSGWKLVYRAATNLSTVSGSDSATLYAFAAGAQIATHQFLVYAGSGFTGAKDGALAASIKDGEGAVGLRDGSGALVDSLGYGTVDPANAFTRGSAAPAPPVVAAGGSIGRFPDGHDTNDNSKDFQVTGGTSPGAANY